MMKPANPTCIAVLCALGGTLGLFGGLDCSSDFDPYNRVTSLRVLAVRSDPAVPAPGETATLSALVYAPTPGDPGTDDPTLRYEWSWCPYPGPANQGYPCLVTEDQLRMLSGNPGLSLGLGADPSATLTNLIVSDDLKSALCEGTNGLTKIDCTGGVAVQIKLTVTTDTDTVNTVFRTRWGLIPDDANLNPEIATLTSLADADPKIIDSTNTNAVALVRGRENQLALAPDLIDQSETYQGLDDNGQPATLQERLFVSWFVETGDTKQASTGYIPGKSAVEVLLQNRWTPALAKKYPPETARIFLVIRDNRAGVGWYEGQVNLTTPPELTP